MLTKSFPKDETFGLTSQLRRAAVSISLNIAEGSARSKKDFNRFLDMARGSVFECVTILKISLDQGYVEKHDFNNLKDKVYGNFKNVKWSKKSLTLTLNYELPTTNF